MRVALLFTLLIAAPAFAGGGWAPYTDGRVGGCAVDNNGNLYGCTPQPQPVPFVPTEPSRRQLEDAYQQGAQDNAAAQSLFDSQNRRSQDAALRRQQQENDALQQQLENERAAHDVQAANDRARRQAIWLASPEGQIEAARQQAEMAARIEHERAQQRKFAAAIGSSRTLSPKECAKKGLVLTCDNHGCGCDAVARAQPFHTEADERAKSNVGTQGE